MASWRAADWTSSRTIQLSDWRDGLCSSKLCSARERERQTDKRFIHNKVLRQNCQPSTRGEPQVDRSLNKLHPLAALVARRRRVRPLFVCGVCVCASPTLEAKGKKEKKIYIYLCSIYTTKRWRRKSFECNFKRHAPVAEAEAGRFALRRVASSAIDVYLNDEKSILVAIFFTSSPPSSFSSLGASFFFILSHCPFRYSSDTRVDLFSLFSDYYLYIHWPPPPLEKGQRQQQRHHIGNCLKLVRLHQ